MLTSRFVTFYKSLVASKKKPIRFLARIMEADQRTVLGRTLSKLLALSGPGNQEFDRLSASLLKRKMVYQEVSTDEKWWVPACRELLELRQQKLDLPGFENDEIQEMLDYICVT